MNEDAIVQLMLTSGNEVIGEVAEDDPETGELVLKNTLKITRYSGESDDGEMYHWYSMSPFMSMQRIPGSAITVRGAHIISVGAPTERAIDGYKDALNRLIEIESEEFPEDEAIEEYNPTVH